MGKHSGGGRISRPISGASVGGTIIPNNSQRITRSNWNSFTNANILAAEQSIRANNYETAFEFDSDGNLLQTSKGGSGSVAMGVLKPNSIVTHNHPSGASFSKTDVMTSFNANLSEIRAVGTKRTYSLKRGKEGWGDRSKLIPAISRAEIRTREKLTMHIRRGAAISEKEQKVRIRQANELHWHLVWKAVAKEMGYEYRKSTQ